MKKFLVSLGVASVVVGSAVWWSQRHETADAESVVAQAETPPVAVSTQAKSESREAKRVVMTPGTIEAEQSTTLRAGVAGFVAQLPIVLGQSVSTGAIVATIDDTTNSLPVEGGVKSGGYQQSQIDETIARKQYEQAKKAYRSDKTSAKKTDRAIAKLTAEKALIDAVSAADNRTVRAPFAGVIAEKFVDQGVAVKVGDSIATVTQGSKRVLRFFIDPSDAARVTPKQTIGFVLQDGTEYQGMVTRIAPLPDTITRKVLIEATLSKEAVGASIGTLGTVKIGVVETVSTPDVFFVPLEAVTTGQNESFIFTEADGIVHKQTVTVRKIEGVWAQVSWDGPEDARIITQGAKQVADGARVLVR